MNDPAVSAGSYVLHIEGTGRFGGSVDLPFEIVKADPVITFAEDSLFLLEELSDPSYLVRVEPECPFEITNRSLDENGQETVYTGSPERAGDYEVVVYAGETEYTNIASAVRNIHVVEDESISIVPDISLMPGQQLILSILKKELKNPDARILYATSDEQVVEIGEDGILSAGMTGTAVVTVSAENSTAVASCVVTVQDTMTTLVLPASLKHIEEAAFENMSSVQRIQLCRQVQSIENRAFAGYSTVSE